MADVTGPISTLPGSRHTFPYGTMCDEHPDRPAVARIQGETDSFGCEMNDCCQECVDEIRSYAAEARCGQCDWCKHEATDLRDARDYEEGMCGPVYRVCGECIRQRNEAAREELDRYYDARFDEWDDDFDDWDPSDDDEPIRADDWVDEPVRAIPSICKHCRQSWQPGHKCRTRPIHR